MNHPDSMTVVAEQFEDAQQQRETATLGMWTFLATEVLFFGGLFLAYAVYRHVYPAGFAMGSRQTDLFFGTFNTALLLTSSLTMALAVHSARNDRMKPVGWFLFLTVFLAIGFVIVKGFEYRKDILNQLVPGPGLAPFLPAQAGIFFWLYWAMTGLHALHVLIGIGVLSVMTWLTTRRRFSSRYHTPIEVAGLYWHFVDVVWIFLYPLLYLIDRHG